MSYQYKVPDFTNLDQEEAIGLEIEAIYASFLEIKGSFALSLCRASRDFSIPYATFHN
jgi:hypothetical protein